MSVNLRIIKSLASSHTVKKVRTKVWKHVGFQSLIAYNPTCILLNLSSFHSSPRPPPSLWHYALPALHRPSNHLDDKVVCVGPHVYRGAPPYVCWSLLLSILKLLFTTLHGSPVPIIFISTLRSFISCEPAHAVQSAKMLYTTYTPLSTILNFIDVLLLSTISRSNLHSREYFSPIYVLSFWLSFPSWSNFTSWATSLWRVVKTVAQRELAHGASAQRFIHRNRVSWPTPRLVLPTPQWLNHAISPLAQYIDIEDYAFS